MWRDCLKWANTHSVNRTMPPSPPPRKWRKSSVGLRSHKRYNELLSKPDAHLRINMRTKWEDWFGCAGHSDPSFSDWSEREWQMSSPMQTHSELNKTRSSIKWNSFHMFKKTLVLYLNVHNIKHTIHPEVATFTASLSLTVRPSFHFWEFMDLFGLYNIKPEWILRCIHTSPT